MLRGSGFTLIELMITMVVIAILAAIALPSYNSYIQRGKITEATSTLSELRLRAEKFFADNRTYAGFPDAITGTRYFTYTCPTKTVNTFTCQATGIGDMAPFRYTINESNTRTSTFTSLPGWINSTSCWVTKKNETC